MERHVGAWTRACLSALAGLALLLGLAGPAAAQGKSTGTYLAEASVRVTGKVAEAKGYGYAEGISILGAWVNASKNIAFDLPLTADAEYIFLAGGDNDAEDVDLAILDRNGKVLAEDVRTAADAVVSFKPAATGNYTMRLTLYKSTKNVPCVCVAVALKKGGWDVPLKNLDSATDALIRQLAAEDEKLQKNGKRSDLRRADNQWAVFGAVLEKGKDTSVVNMNLGTGPRAFFAAADKNAKDVDLFLYDAQRKEVAKDIGTEPTASIRHEPGPGVHELRMLNYDSNGPTLVMMAVFDIYGK